VTRGSVAAALLVGLACACAKSSPPPPIQQDRVQDRSAEKTETFEATAYTIEGETAAGTQTRRGVVAADPKVLAIGTRIRVEGAGPLSGEYRVEDTGRAVKGREIDIYVPTAAAAKQFGRKQVQVQVLSRGDGDVP
jgi:3D (Asp-Asp-Asp) domain-containing protein